MTTVGTCAICDRELAVRDSHGYGNLNGVLVLVHHGYQRPGDGAIHGDCFAVGREPHELSSHAAAAYRAFCELTLAALRKALVLAEGNGVDVYSRFEHVPVPTTAVRPEPIYCGSVKHDSGWQEALIAYRRDEVEPRRRRIFDDLRADHIVRTRHSIEWNEREIARMKVAVSTWVKKPLREHVEVPPKRPRRRGWRAF